MFICSCCGAEHNRYRDNDRSRSASYCLSCHAKYIRETRPKYSELTPEQRKKSNARSYANNYQRRGVIEKIPCQVCGDENSQKHHENYDWPLAVEWLCRGCHLAVHRGEVPRIPKPFQHNNSGVATETVLKEFLKLEWEAFVRVCHSLPRKPLYRRQRGVR